jgi:hypothetical protein
MPTGDDLRAFAALILALSILIWLLDWWTRLGLP